MSYTIIGSLTSPFVRRIRMLMESIPYEMKELNIYETDDGIVLNKINPINQIPVLIIGETKIWDSRQIFNYLNRTYKLQNMDWDDENTLTAIDGAMNSGISLMQMKRSGMNIDEPFMFVNRQKDRIESILDYLKPYIQNQAMTEWNFQIMSLYAFLDWALFRNVIKIDHRPECQKFMAAHAERNIVKLTAIPKV